MCVCVCVKALVLCLRETHALYTLTALNLDCMASLATQVSWATRAILFRNLATDHSPILGGEGCIRALT